MRVHNYVGDEGLTGFRRENIVIIQHVLDPSHHVVDVYWCCKLYLLVILVDPCVIKSEYQSKMVVRNRNNLVYVRRPCRHGWTCTRCAALCDNSVEQIQVVVKIENCFQIDWYVTATSTLAHSLFEATHSITSTYFGSMTIVLKFPLTSAASTNGLHRNNGFWVMRDGDGGTGG